MSTHSIRLDTKALRQTVPLLTEFGAVGTAPVVSADGPLSEWFTHPGFILGPDVQRRLDYAVYSIGLSFAQQTLLALWHFHNALNIETKVPPKLVEWAMDMDNFQPWFYAELEWKRFDDTVALNLVSAQSGLRVETVMAMLALIQFSTQHGRIDTSKTVEVIFTRLIPRLLPLIRDWRSMSPPATEPTAPDAIINYKVIVMDRIIAQISTDERLAKTAADFGLDLHALAEQAGQTYDTTDVGPSPTSSALNAVLNRPTE